MQRRDLIPALAAAICLPPILRAETQTSRPPDRLALQKTSEAIRAAFSAGDVFTAMRFHHPGVVKALAYKQVLIGRDAVAQNLDQTVSRFHLEFTRNDVESLIVLRDTAVEQTLFTIKATSVDNGKARLFSGRTMVVYVRYPESPTGWASIREIIQPATS